MPQTKLLLIVDDTDLSRLATCLLANSLGYNTDDAASGTEAIEKLALKKYSGIIMDYQMPGLTGKDCTEYIRTTLKSSIPIIGYTASEDSKVFATCIESGMDACLNKNCPSQQLEDTLKSLLFCALVAD